jgi:hypothetical protein
MAYQFADSMDHYNTALLAALGVYELVGGTPLISSSYARFAQVGSLPNQGLFLPGNAGVRKNLKSNQATLIAFLSFGSAALPISGQQAVISFHDNGNPQVVLCVSPTGAIQFGNPFGSVFTPIGPSSALGVIAPAPTTAPNHGIEIRVVIDGTNGSVQCWLDGNMIIPLTSGLNTKTTANAYANQVQLGEMGGFLSANTYCDYLRVWDTTGSYQNAPVGYDCRKLTKLPTGVGALTGWTPNGAAANWQCVDDNPPDEDTTYVSSGGLNSDSYAMGSSGLSGVPSMVVVKSRVRKDAGTPTLQIGVRSGSSNGLAAAATIATTYGFIDACISVDPATGLPATAAASDAYQHLKFQAS